MPLELTDRALKTEAMDIFNFLEGYYELSGDQLDSKDLLRMAAVLGELVSKMVAEVATCSYPEKEQLPFALEYVEALKKTVIRELKEFKKL